MSDPRRQLGDFGESAAAALLVRQGLQLVARKWRCAEGEIDLVLRDGEELVFVEVRTRRGSLSALESVGPAKRRRLARLAQRYLEQSGAAPEAPWRIDVVAVQVGAGGRVTSIEHIASAIEE